MVGGGLELVQIHNAWIINQAKTDDPTSYHRWGAVYEGLPYPILPLWVKSTKVREYNRKLLAWAQEQRSPAGAGPTSSKGKPEDFLSVFADGPAGGNGPYLPVETDPEGRAAVNGANIKTVLDHQQQLLQQASATILELQSRLAEVAAQQQKQQQQHQTQLTQLHSQMQTQQQQQQQQQPQPQPQLLPAPLQPVPQYAVQYLPHPQYQQPQYQQQPYQPQYHMRQPRPSGPIVCNRCHGEGHIARDCQARNPAPAARNSRAVRGGDEGGNPQ